MFDRISNSFAMARSSWQVLRTDKQLIFFPIVSGIGCFLVLLSFALPFIAHPQWLDFINNNAQRRQPPPWVYIVAFAYYFCNYFVIVFCNAALISCAIVRFNGGTPTLADGFRAAASRLPQIVAWALVSATVGVILKAIENANEKAGQFISAILGTAWTVLTYFVVPVLVVEKTGPLDAIKRSMSILRKAWGKRWSGTWASLVHFPSHLAGNSFVRSGGRPVYGEPGGRCSHDRAGRPVHRSGLSGGVGPARHLSGRPLSICRLPPGAGWI